MSDLLAAFAAEQAADEAREQRLLQQLGADDSSATAAATSSSTSGDTSGRQTARRPHSAARSRPASSSAAASASYAASAAPAASVAALSPAEDDEDLTAGFDVDFQLRPLLWSQLKAACAPAEHPELRRMLGAAAVDANDALEQEVRALLSIASTAQLRNARARQAAAASAASAPASWNRVALPDSATRQYLTQEVQSLLTSLRNQALRSGILPADDASPDPSLKRGGASSTSSASSLAKILPRPETARAQRVLDEAVNSLTRRDTHSAGQMVPSSAASTSTSASSAPGSRPASGGGPMTARPSTARLRSLSSLSNRSDSPRSDSASSAASLSTAASVLSQSLLSTSARPDSARSTLLHSLRQALQEEHAALLQDVEYLQACLELEMEAAVEGEKREQKTRVSSTAGATDCASVDDAPASVPELRALNEQLKAALHAEEQRSHTLAMMGAVSAAQQGLQHVHSSPLTARGNLAAPLVSPSASSFGSSFAKSPGPLKAVRVPSASRVRPASGGGGGGGGGLLSPSPSASPQASPSPSTAATLSFAARLNEAQSSSPQLGAAVSPVSSEQELQDLIDNNADLFADPSAPALASAPAASASANASSSSQPRPVIPTLALSSLRLDAFPATAAGSGTIDHFPPAPNDPAATAAVGHSQRETNNHVQTPIRSNPSHAAALENGHLQGARESSRRTADSPATARSSSKARSRIQAAQSFQPQD